MNTSTLTSRGIFRLQLTVTTENMREATKLEGFNLVSDIKTILNSYTEPFKIMSDEVIKYDTAKKIPTEAAIKRLVECTLKYFSFSDALAMRKNIQEANDNKRLFFQIDDFINELKTEEKGSYGFEIIDDEPEMIIDHTAARVLKQKIFPQSKVNTILSKAFTDDDYNAIKFHQRNNNEKVMLAITSFIKDVYEGQDLESEFEVVT